MDAEKQGCNGILANTDENDAPEDTSPRPIHGWKWAIAYASMISTSSTDPHGWLVSLFTPDKDGLHGAAHAEFP